MSRSLKKGPFIDDHLLKKIQAMNEKGEKLSDQDLESSLDHFPRTCWAYYRCS